MRSHGVLCVVQVFEDNGISGAKGRDKRPGLDAPSNSANTPSIPIAKHPLEIGISVVQRVVHEAAAAG